MTSSETLVTQKEISKTDKSVRIDDLSKTNFQFHTFQLEKGTPARVNFLASRNVALIQFCFQGECTNQSNSGKKPVEFKNSEYNILYIPQGDFCLSTTSDEVNVLNIFIEEEFFLRQIPEGHFVFSLKRNHTFGAVFSQNLHINPKLKSILNEINTCEFDGHLRMLYLKAKVIELLTIQLAQSTETITGLKPDEIEKMMLVKHLIESNLNESYSLAHLAKAAGTNEQYLKKHFKLLFGNTVFGYILECRMHRAKELLLQGDYRITEIAGLIGYQHATHFTSAFKKFFGYLPKALKAKILVGTYFAIHTETLQLLITI